MCIKSNPGNYSKCPFLKSTQTLRGDVTREDSLRRSFCATQHCNVGTMLQPFETMSQQCCSCVALKIVVAIKGVLLRQKADL